MFSGSENMDGWIRARELLPSYYRQALPEEEPAGTEEIRLRVEREPTLLLNGRERCFSRRLCTEKDLLLVLDKASGASFHTAVDSLRDGYLTTRGIRIGVCGNMLKTGNGGGYRSFRSLALRIPHECRGIARDLLPKLTGWVSDGTLLLSPPGGGKTTLLRECIRCLSNGGLRVGVVDERNELAGTDESEGGFDLGSRSDVLTGCGKAEGAMQLLRAMNPEMIAMDEITRRQDLDAIAEIAGCGVGLLATVHAMDPGQMRRRPLYRELLSLGIFSHAVCIERHESGRIIQIQELIE